MTTYATKGQGTAIHIAIEINGTTATACDRWAVEGNLLGTRRKGAVRRIDAAAPTCKSCIRNTQNN